MNPEPTPRKPLSEGRVAELWRDACDANIDWTYQLVLHFTRSVEREHGIEDSK